MIFTKSTAYALQALIELSKYDSPKDVNFLSENANLPKPFLAKLLQNLSKKGIVKSIKGIHGGFLLVKKPVEISIYEIFKAMEDKDSIVFYCSSDSENCIRNRETICQLGKFFTKLEEELATILKKYTLEDVIKDKAC